MPSTLQLTRHHLQHHQRPPCVLAYLSACRPTCLCLLACRCPSSVCLSHAAEFVRGRCSSITEAFVDEVVMSVVVVVDLPTQTALHRLGAYARFEGHCARLPSSLLHHFGYSTRLHQLDSTRLDEAVFATTTSSCSGDALSLELGCWTVAMFRGVERKGKRWGVGMLVEQSDALCQQMLRRANEV